MPLFGIQAFYDESIMMRSNKIQETNSRMRWLIYLRTLAAWLLLFAVINLFISSYWIAEKYPGMWYAPSPPAPPTWLVYWRMISFYTVLAASLVSVPKLPFWIGFASIFVWAFCFAHQ
jgi:hypothetical protein